MLEWGVSITNILYIKLQNFEQDVTVLFGAPIKLSAKYFRADILLPILLEKDTC